MQWLTALTSSQWWAASRHYITYGVGIACGIAVTLGYMTASDQTEIAQRLGDLFANLNKVWLDLVAIATILAPIINGIVASRKASPQGQIKSVADMAKDPAQPATTEAKVALVNAAASLPEVQRVVSPELAPNPATAANVVIH